MEEYVKSFAAKPPEGTTWHAPPLAGQDFPPEQPVYEPPLPTISPEPVYEARSPSTAIRPEPGTVKNFTLIRDFTTNYKRNLLLVDT